MSFETEHDSVAPDAHSLDFDWRFTARTLASLIAAISGRKRVLCLGAPTLWSAAADIAAIDTLDLVERNPFLTLANVGEKRTRYVADISSSPFLDLSRRYDVCVLDSPWYPNDLKCWLGWAIRHLDDDGEIIFSLWPEHTRPSAQSERIDLFRQLKSFGRYEIKVDQLNYQVPEFEQRCLSKNGQPLREGRSGDAVHFWPSTKARACWPIPTAIPMSAWLRLQSGVKQVAIRITPDRGSREFVSIFKDQTWQLKTVSRRDRTRPQIDFWTSDGFVAAVPNTTKLIEEITKSVESIRAPHSEIAQLYRELFSIGKIDINRLKKMNWIQIEWNYLN